MGTHVEMFGSGEAGRFEELARSVGGDKRQQPEGPRGPVMDELLRLTGAERVEQVQLADLRGVALCCRGWRQDMDRRADMLGLSMWGPAQRAAHAAVKAPAVRAAIGAAMEALYPGFREACLHAVGSAPMVPYKHAVDLEVAICRRVLVECPRDFGFAEASGGAEPWASLCRLWAAGYAPLGVCGGTLFVWALPRAEGQVHEVGPTGGFDNPSGAVWSLESKPDSPAMSDLFISKDKVKELAQRLRDRAKDVSSSLAWGEPSGNATYRCEGRAEAFEDAARDVEHLLEGGEA